MKHLVISIVATFIACTGFAQTSKDFKIAYHQRIVQGLSDVPDAISKNVIAVKTIEMEGGKTLEYAEQGNAGGMSVILLHGLTDSWHSFDNVLPLLPHNYHVLAISQRGHGNSAKTFNRYHTKDFAHDVAVLVQKLQLSPAIVVGHSMGGVIAQQFAIDYPRHTKGLVIVSSDASFNTSPALPQFYEAVQKLQDPIDREFMYGFQKSTFAKPVSEISVDSFVAESMKVPAAVFQATLKGIMETDIVAALHNIKVPTLIVWGDKDGICPLAGQRLMQQKIQKARLIIYEGTGHALHWEAPERFANDLLKFFKIFD